MLSRPLMHDKGRPAGYQAVSAGRFGRQKIEIRVAVSPWGLLKKRGRIAECEDEIASSSPPQAGIPRPARERRDKQ